MRSFKLAHERSRTLKEAFVNRSRARPRIEALHEVDLRVRPGEAVGMVGRNGAGKSSTLRCLAGIIPLDSGRAECGGRVLSLLELGAGFGADFSGRENIYLNGALHGFDRDEIDARVDQIIEFSELGEFIDVPVKAYSSGMYLRLGFSIVAHLDADVLLIDEILTVGDASFQQKCLRRISEQMAAGATVVLVSHDPGAIERVCDRLLVLDRGRLVFDGPVAEGLLFYHRLLGMEDGGSEVLPAERRGALRVTELELHDGDGRRRHAFRAGEPLRVEMAITAEALVDRPMLALEVRDARGQLCFRTDTSLGEPATRTAVSFEVPRLALLGGEYDVAVGAYGQDAPGSGMLDRIASFAVMPTLEGEGLVDLRGSWTIAGEPARQEALGSSSASGS